MAVRSTPFILNIFWNCEYIRKHNETVAASALRYVHYDEPRTVFVQCLSSVNQKYAKQKIMHLENLCILLLESPLQVSVLHNDAVVNSWRSHEVQSFRDGLGSTTCSRTVPCCGLLHWPTLGWRNSSDATAMSDSICRVGKTINYLRGFWKEAGFAIRMCCPNIP
jgi:hypothetical protein